MNKKIETLSRWELFEAMCNRTVVVVGGFNCIINGIQMEDGSGHKFIVTVGTIGYFSSSLANVFVNELRRTRGEVQF
jgi:hypothetical protein